MKSTHSATTQGLPVLTRNGGMKHEQNPQFVGKRPHEHGAFHGSLY